MHVCWRRMETICGGSSAEGGFIFQRDSLCSVFTFNNTRIGYILYDYIKPVLEKNHVTLLWLCRSATSTKR